MTERPIRPDDHDHPILEAFNAEEVVEDPGPPDKDDEPPSPANESAAPAPPG